MLLPDDQIRILTALQKGEVHLQGQFLNSSNYTFLVEVQHAGETLGAVYKPTRGEQPLWDFPTGTLAKREVAAYRLSERLGWQLVPPTLYRRAKLPLGAGSLQFYVDYDPNDHYFNFSQADVQCLRPIVVFDLLANNADRKGSHILRAADGHFWLIDHGVCFNIEDKLRTVVWDFAGQEIPAELLVDVQQLADDLAGVQVVPEDFKGLLRLSEVRALSRRARTLLETRTFPIPSRTHRPYPYPPL
jgi:uncharacterized repeat protein (TIGR03843 family)